MADTPTTGDREQQRKDNLASRRQSGLEPMPKDRDEAAGDEGGSGDASADDEMRRRVEAASGGEPVVEADLDEEPAEEDRSGR